MEAFDKLRYLHGLFIIIIVATNRNISFLIKLYIIEYTFVHMMYYTINPTTDPLTILKNTINS